MWWELGWDTKMAEIDEGSDQYITIIVSQDKYKEKNIYKLWCIDDEKQPLVYQFPILSMYWNVGYVRCKH